MAKPINIVPYTTVELNIRDNGDEYEDGKWRSARQLTLQEIIDGCKRLQIPESEWGKISLIPCTYPKSNDTFLYVEYNKSKSTSEIELETKKAEKDLLEKEAAKQQRKLAREAKKAAKKEALEKLDPAVKRMLGL